MALVCVLIDAHQFVAFLSKSRPMRVLAGALRADSRHRTPITHTALSDVGVPEPGFADRRYTYV